MKGGAELDWEWSNRVSRIADRWIWLWIGRTLLHSVRFRRRINNNT
jgi:hypothetical protein